MCIRSSHALLFRIVFVRIRALPIVPVGYEQAVTNLTVSAADAEGNAQNISASLVLAWTCAPEAVAEVLAQREADKRDAEMAALKADVIQLSAEVPQQAQRHQAKLSVAVDDNDVEGAVAVIGDNLESHSAWLLPCLDC